MLKVVVESTFDHWADRDLDFGKEAFHCLRHEVGSRMAQDFESVRRGGKNRLGLLSDQGGGDIDNFSIHSGGNGFCEAPTKVFLHASIRPVVSVLLARAAMWSNVVHMKKKRGIINLRCLFPPHSPVQRGLLYFVVIRF